ncbi:unnamed protein product [Linum trigynum]|uniref:Ubiquitin-like domain-containing protein n=1 Tax=Linum trigynum TaxID=586398 RepID=A0AAV2DNA6_9ROSI
MEAMKSMKKEAIFFMAQNNNERKKNDSVKEEMRVEEWEMRPGGMLVQKSSNNSHPLPIVPMITVKVKFGSSYHNVSISSQASFGELKKMLAGETGVHPEDQKLMYKKKERDSKAYLDVARVKNGSKIVLIEDITSRERRCLEMLKSSRLHKASKSIDHITTEVNSLVHKVISLEAASGKGGIVAEKDIDDLTEALMSKLVELDGVLVDGSLKLQKTTQERRVQKHIEILDMLKLEIGSSSNGSSKVGNLEAETTTKQKQEQQQQKVEAKAKDVTVLQLPVVKQCDAVVVTTKWETFD